MFCPNSPCGRIWTNPRLPERRFSRGLSVVSEVPEENVTWAAAGAAMSSAAAAMEKRDAVDICRSVGGYAGEPGRQALGQSSCRARPARGILTELVTTRP